MNRLDQIREKLKAQQNKGNNSNFNRDNTVFPHWKIQDDSAVTVRFLPDGNPDNIFFWVEKQVINLPFHGIKGRDYNDTVVVQVPCLDMWKPKSCPITQEISPWFSTDLDATARTYWKKRSYLFQGFVINNDLEDEESRPENPIRRFILSKSLFKIVQESLLDSDSFDDLPTDYENGVNFKIKKTKSGQYADYTTSGWDRRESALTEDQLRAIDTHGLFNLSDFLPSRPNDDQVDIIFDMFKASLDGQAYDVDRWKDHFKPWNLDQILNDVAIEPTSSSDVDNGDSTVDDDDEDVATAKNDTVPEPAPANVKQNTADLLEQLRNRAKSSS